MLVLIVSISLLFSYFIGNSLFASEGDRTAQVEEVHPISPEFAQPDPEIFNEDAINLVERIDVGDTNTTNPFAEDDE